MPFAVPLREPWESLANISAELPGREHKGRDRRHRAHYDTHKDALGANDNGSAVAALLELARHFTRREAARTLRFVAFTVAFCRLYQWKDAVPTRSSLYTLSPGPPNVVYLDL